MNHESIDFFSRTNTNGIFRLQLMTVKIFSRCVFGDFPGSSFGGMSIFMVHPTQLAKTSKLSALLAREFA
jgi:hypothetical protein